MIQENRILLLDILTVLQKYSDEKHPMIQKKIIDILERDFGYENLYARRKTVKNNILKLLRHFERTGPDEIGISFEALSHRSQDKNADNEIMPTGYTDFSYLHEFTYGELHLIIDGIVFSKKIPSNRRKKIIRKLEGLSSTHFKSRTAHISLLPGKELVNHELFLNIEVIDEAISNRQQISFNYNSYGVDKRLQLVLETRKDESGKAREYIINPYQMAPSNGHYYLICNNDKFDNLSHYRLDRITNIKLLDAKQKALKRIKGKEHGLDLANYMDEHIYMFSGESIFISLRFENRLLSDFVDWFGTKNVSFSNRTEGEITASVKTNKEAMRKWALQYALHVRVLSPEDLVEEIKEDIKIVMKNYGME
ncbi:WYL domain-containing protein [Clostridium sp.]|uniref:helix-turn-helix transcriptional regulator n=1 Tax=Clostridium sp. TaxID=1506 RepID=UPI00260ECD06|nr:WYL domain-containing protein [Clostridium sp.]